MTVCEFCKCISFKSTDPETPTRATDTEFQLLPPKFTLVEAVEPGSISSPYDHHSSILNLIESGSSCCMCKAILDLFDDSDTISQAKECANTGSYTKIQIVSAEGDSNNIKTKAALKHVQITSNSRVWSSKPFAISLDQTRFADRAIWNCSGSVKFEDRSLVIKEWLSDCNKDHHNCCNSTQEQTNLPARLIDVGNPDEFKQSRLIPTQDIITTMSDLRYVALSHCWGTSAMPLRTTKDTLDAHLAGISHDRLPKTFRDAVRITQELGIRFLWIDSLCIIQDDEADWQREAAKMASVYRQAYLTIVAASARNSQEGCYIDPQPPTLQFEVISPETRLDSSSRKAYIRAPYPRSSFTEDQVSQSPISRRGWTFQEMILSARTVFFAKDQIYWHCNSLYASEDGTLDVHSDPDDNTGVKGRGSWLKPYRIDDERDSFFTWWSWVMEFNSRLLTKSSDVLPAFAGIIQYFEKQRDDEPLVGLWRKSIIYDLLWVPLGNPEHCERRSGIPSWSWASIDTYAIVNPSLQNPFGNESESASNAVFLYLQGCTEDMTEDQVNQPIFPEFVKSNIVYSGVPLTSPLLRCELVIRGRVLPCKYRKDRLTSTIHPNDFTGDSHKYFHSHGNDLDVDFDKEIPEIGTPLLCMLMSFIGDLGEIFIFLVLQEVESSEGHYKRIGIARRSEIVRMDIASMDLKEITIV